MKHTRKKLGSILLSLALMLSLVPAFSMTALADDAVSYIDHTVSGNTATAETKTCESYTVLTDQTAWADGTTYVANSNVTIADRITVTGTVNLILCDGATLTASSGITVASGNTLNIYAQSDGEGMGSLTATGSANAAGIGGSSSAGGTVNIHGGNLTVTGGSFAAAIGAGKGQTYNSITIFGGTINATSGSNAGAAIGAGDGNNSAGGTITIYGGTVNATGIGYAAGIGGGTNDSTAGTVTINGGTVTATGGNSTSNYIPAGIGAASYRKTNESVTINGGTVIGIGGSADAGGIGKNYKDGGSVTPGTITLGENMKLSYSTDGNTYTEYASDDYTNRPQYMKAEHPHSFTYSASGNTITATCGNTDGKCTLSVWNARWKTALPR